MTKLELLESGDGDFLAATGLVVNAAAWHRKNIRVNTKAVYQQHKFNLLREEGEGFAKLITVLNRVGAASLTDKSLPGLVRLPWMLQPLHDDCAEAHASGSRCKFAADFLAHVIKCLQAQVLGVSNRLLGASSCEQTGAGMATSQCGDQFGGCDRCRCWRLGA